MFQSKTLCGLLVVALNLPVVGWAADNLRMHGALVYEACDIQPGDEDMTLELGMVADRFLYFNTRTPSRAINLHLINCDSAIGNMVTLTFSGTQNAALPGFLALDGRSVAQGIAIGIETMDGQPIPVNVAGKTFPLVNGANVVTVKGFIQGEPGALASHSLVRGPFTAITTFNLNYN